MTSKTCQSCGTAHAEGTPCPKYDVNDVTLAPKTPAPDADATMAPSGEQRAGIPATDCDRSPLDKDFGDYVLLEELARGGMGIVYRARHKELNRIVAIKMIISGEYSSELDVQRFQLEAKAAAQLDHSGIVPIYEINSHQGQPYFAMKLVEGGSLAENRERFLSDPRKTAKLIAQAARAVHHAHQRGILHRDIKPANILLDEDDQPLLTDLGLAKLSTGESNLTQTGAVLGTPSYMPPEQAKSSQSLTTAADIYSLGAILYELLSGKPPHRGDTALETVLQVVNEPIVPVREIDSQVDRDLELICMTCLRKDPDARYATAGDLADDLESWLDGLPISIKPASVFTRAAHWIRHNQGIMYLVMLLLAAMVLTLPLAISVLSSLDDVANLYTQTDDDPLPLIFSFTKMPTWVPFVGGFGVLLLWPATGALVSIVTRPRNWWRAAVNGVVVAGITSLFMTLLMGWVPFTLASQEQTTKLVRALATDTWATEEASSAKKTQEILLDKYPFLENVPDEEKASYLADRAFADGVAIGPTIVVSLFVLGLIFGMPIVYGAVIAHVLLARRQRWWIFAPRYMFAWLTTFITVGLTIAAFTGEGVVNGTRMRDLPIWRNALMVGIPALIVFLTVRRWRKPNLVDDSRSLGNTSVNHAK